MMVMQSCLPVFLMVMFAFLPNGETLRCFRCDHNEISADTNAVVKFFLNQLSKVDHPECKMDDHTNKYDVDVVECPPAADSGKRYVCGTIRGTVTTSVGIVSFDWDTTVRDCVQVPAFGAEYDNKCSESDAVSEPVRALLEKAVSTVENFDLDGDVKFKGTTCYDTNTVPQTEDEQQCASCTWNRLKTEASFLGPVLDMFSKLNDDTCRLEKNDDKYRIAQRICPEPSMDHRAKCGVINGEVTTQFLGIDFKFHTLERGCVEEPEAAPFTHCETELPSSGVVRDLATRGLTDLNLGDIKFDGTICYNGDGFGNVNAAIKQSINLFGLTLLLILSLSCTLFSRM